MTLTIDLGVLNAPEPPAMASATFRGGPLDGKRDKVPAYGPAWVRWHDAEGVHWYAHKAGSKRTYLYVGVGL